MKIVQFISYYFSKSNLRLLDDDDDDDNDDDKLFLWYGWPKKGV